MRTLIVCICFSLFLISCNDSSKKENNLSDDASVIESKENPETNTKNQPIVQDEKTNKEQLSNNDEESNSAASINSGTYINSGHEEDSSCKCYCIEVSSNGTSELCLKENEIYIKARFEQSGQNIDIFYAGTSSKTSEKNIPWKEFETGTPIAVLTPTNNGFELDWKGFSIDGKIAIDYALYGKKTLEGTYKKK